MELSEIGEFANRFWNEIPNHFPFVELGEFVVMPNHVHGIIIIDKPINTRNNATVETANLDVLKNNKNQMETAKLGDKINCNNQMETAKLAVSTGTTNPNRQRTINASEKWNPETLGVIINQYKRMVTINARKINADFEWQALYHDHIIRNDESFRRISDYIQNNPSNWKDDKFFNP